MNTYIIVGFIVVIVLILLGIWCYLKRDVIKQNYETIRLMQQMKKNLK